MSSAIELLTCITKQNAPKVGLLEASRLGLEKIIKKDFHVDPLIYPLGLPFMLLSKHANDDVDLEIVMKFGSLEFKTKLKNDKEKEQGAVVESLNDETLVFYFDTSEALPKQEFPSEMKNIELKIEGAALTDDQIAVVQVENSIPLQYMLGGTELADFEDKDTVELDIMVHVGSSDNMKISYFPTVTVGFHIVRDREDPSKKFYLDKIVFILRIAKDATRLSARKIIHNKAIKKSKEARNLVTVRSDKGVLSWTDLKMAKVVIKKFLKRFRIPKAKVNPDNCAIVVHANGIQTARQKPETKVEMKDDLSMIPVRVAVSELSTDTLLNTAPAGEEYTLRHLLQGTSGLGIQETHTIMSAMDALVGNPVQLSSFDVPVNCIAEFNSPLANKEIVRIASELTGKTKFQIVSEIMNSNFSAGKIRDESYESTIHQASRIGEAFANMEDNYLRIHAAMPRISIGEESGISTTFSGFTHRLLAFHNIGEPLAVYGYVGKDNTIIAAVPQLHISGAINIPNLHSNLRSTADPVSAFASSMISASIESGINFEPTTLPLSHIGFEAPLPAHYHAFHNDVFSVASAPKIPQVSELIQSFAGVPLSRIQVDMQSENASHIARLPSVTIHAHPTINNAISVVSQDPQVRPIDAIFSPGDDVFVVAHYDGSLSSERIELGSSVKNQPAAIIGGHFMSTPKVADHFYKNWIEQNSTKTGKNTSFDPISFSAASSSSDFSNIRDVSNCMSELSRIQKTHGVVLAPINAHLFDPKASLAFIGKEERSKYRQSNFKKEKRGKGEKRNKKNRDHVKLIERGPVIRGGSGLTGPAYRGGMGGGFRRSPGVPYRPFGRMNYGRAGYNNPWSNNRRFWNNYSGGWWIGRRNRYMRGLWPFLFLTYPFLAGYNDHQRAEWLMANQLAVENAYPYTPY